MSFQYEASTSTPRGSAHIRGTNGRDEFSALLQNSFKITHLSVTESISPEDRNDVILWKQ
jgi:hypothetical protein